ncbi:nuclear transport factor 2 family protein [Nonomuraea longicatena]|uniref:SnoaL-like domain-containing protein n=1 Tax=Nonomuraea longicatena TaxID=83682 RepID=A0ABP4ADI9_9ACTN
MKYRIAPCLLAFAFLVAACGQNAGRTGSAPVAMTPVAAVSERPLSKAAKIKAVNRFFTAYAAGDMDGIRAVLTEDVQWTIPGHHPLSGTKRGVDEVVAFFTQLGKGGFQAEPMFLEANADYVVDIHRGWTTKGNGKVDTMWALVWHFNREGKIDRVFNLSGDQHQMDAYVWGNYTLKPIPGRLQ